MADIGKNVLLYSVANHFSEQKSVEQARKSWIAS